LYVPSLAVTVSKFKLIGNDVQYQILAVHTFIAALWGTGIKARGVAFGLVSLTCVYIALWVGINSLIHQDFVAPTPVGQDQSLSSHAVSLRLTLSV
jgi:hypothetical protein